jgi:hypothetical protein
MTIASMIQSDHSELLAKRFAHLATAYLDQPKDALEPSARIPLENLFRILEMLRYDAFSDEPTSGIVNSKPLEFSLECQQQPWHTEIKQALGTAISENFKAASQEQAIGEIQGVLRWLASGKDKPGVPVIGTTRNFLQRFEQLLR